MVAYFPQSKSDVWITPPEIYDKLNDEFSFDFDPCPINPDFDGLSVEWGQSNFCNPPYSQVAKWIEKSHNEWQKGKTVVLLINAITDTKAFHDYIKDKADIRFIKGRIRFLDCNRNRKAPNVRPSIVCVFQHK